MKRSLQINKPKHNPLRLSINNHHNIEDSCNLKEKSLYDIRLTINNPYDDKCHTPCNDGVYEHCDPKFSLDTHKDSSILMDKICQEESSLEQMFQIPSQAILSCSK